MSDLLQRPLYCAFVYRAGLDTNDSRIRIVYFGIIRYAVYMYMQKKIIYSNIFLESELWLTAAGIRIPCIT